MSIGPDQKLVGIAGFPALLIDAALISRGDVLEAANGKQAVDIATRERPDLMIVDLNTPEMDGYEAIARLRREMAMATLPIIVLTSEEGPGVERRVLELGADDYIVKPFDPAVLLSRVNGVFRRLKVMAA